LVKCKKGPAALTSPIEDDIIYLFIYKNNNDNNKRTTDASNKFSKPIRLAARQAEE